MSIAERSVGIRVQVLMDLLDSERRKSAELERQIYDLLYALQGQGELIDEMELAARKFAEGDEGDEDDGIEDEVMRVLTSYLGKRGNF